MARGRPAKSSVIKELEGNREKLGVDKIRRDPPGIGRPRVPTHLTPDERKFYLDVVASLPVKLLSRADEWVLERFAVAYADFRRVLAKIRNTGDLVQSPNGPVRNPLYPLLNQARREMHACGSEIGLSPASRARLASIDQGEEDDPMALLLGDDMDPAGAWSTTRN